MSADRLQEVKQRVKTLVETGALSEAAALDILEGETAVYWRTHGRLQPKETPTPNTSIIPRINEQLGGTLTVYSGIAFAAYKVQNGSGAWRAWAIARSLDKPGSGKVKRAELVSYLRWLGEPTRSVQRWLESAINLGLLQENNKGDLHMVNPARAAMCFGAESIGKPATISAKALVCKGWKAHVWAAYLVTLSNPISQARKEQLTGVSERTQRNWQKGIGWAEKNYVDHGVKPSHVTGLREERGLACFVGRGGHLIQRLPDTRRVPMFQAMPGRRGRLRKMQKLLNQSSSLEGRGADSEALKLFCTTSKGVEQAKRQAVRADLPPWEAPREVFLLNKTGKLANWWKAVSCE